MNNFNVGDRVRIIVAGSKAYGEVGVIAECDTTTYPQVSFYIVDFGKVISGLTDKSSENGIRSNTAALFLDYELELAEEREEEIPENGAQKAAELNSKLCKMPRHIEIGLSDDECVIAYRLDDLTEEIGVSAAVILEVKSNPELGDEMASIIAVLKLFRTIREMQDNV